MLTLYQFPISHYSEKIRWALKHKKIEHKVINLLPGFHAKKMIALTGKHSVPVLTDANIAIAESSKILSYLDNHYPNNNLTPTSSTEKQEALEWERFADKEIGIHVRRICYHTLLDNPSIVIAFFSQDAPWYSKLLLRIIFPKLRSKMRKLMNINNESVKESKLRLETALNRINIHTKSKQYLVGDNFSRADLAVAALLAPLFCPEGYGLDWPKSYPKTLQDYIFSISKQLVWAQGIYSRHR
jgi:glutathione S-transferase